MRIKTKLAAAVIGSVAMFNVEAAITRPVATASAAFDWNSLLVTGVNALDSEVDNNSYSSSVSAFYGDDSTNDSADDWNTVLSMNSGNQLTWSNADINTTSLHSYSYDSDDSSVGGLASSGASRSWGFLAAEDGNVTFSINYNLDITQTPGGDNTDANDTHAEVFVDWSGPESFLYSVSDELEFAGKKTGSFTYTLAVLEGQWYTFTAQTSAYANVSAVPLPSAVWLFLTAMMGGLAVSRRKSV